MINNKIMMILFVAVLVVFTGSVKAEVTLVGIDTVAKANWRTAAEFESDNQYGTDGYLIYGLNTVDGRYIAPFDTTVANPDNQAALPDYITNITVDADINMWSGNGNFGTIQNPATNVPENTPLVAGVPAMTFNIIRTSGAFRLTIMLADGDNARVNFISTVDDGSGSVTQNYTHTENGLVYHVYDISSGDSDLVITVDADNNNFNATGFAFDSVHENYPASNPSPENNDQHIMPNITLGWNHGDNVDSQKLYFGKDADSMQLITDLTSQEQSYQLNDLALSKQYFWRIDSIKNSEVYSGPFWSFTTREPGNSNLNDDSAIDLTDLEMLFNHWLESDCVNTQWCYGADLNFSGKVDAADFAIFSQHYNTVFAEDIIFNFETGDLGDWVIFEGAFGLLVCDRATFHNGGEPYNKEGTYYLSTLETTLYTPTDSHTGIVESPVLILTEPQISFLVGGGSVYATRVAICTVDDNGELTEVDAAHGINSEIMQAIDWDKPELINQRIIIRVIDQSTSSWGHITMDNFRAVGVIDQVATAKRRAAAYEKQIGLDGVREVVNDLIDTFGDDYSFGSQYLQQLDQYQQDLVQILADLASGEPTAQARYEQLKTAIDAMKQEVLLSNPLLTNHPIIFVTHTQYRGDHHNTATFFPSYNNEYNDGYFQGGSALKKIDIATGTVTTLLESPTGVIRDPEVHFDGTKIIFSGRNNLSDSYHIYEINIDGSGLTQLTNTYGVDDIDPIYLPDDSIVFSSTREPKYCMCNKHIMCNLFKMEADGANIHQIGKSTLFEGHSSLLPDGRIVYYRWEYVDRNFGDAQGLWTVNPDGTDHAVYWGNNTNSPGGVLDPRVVPGTEMFISTFSSCHDRPWGAIALVDRRFGVDGRESVIRTWPESAINLVGVGNYDTFKSVNPKYEDPYPLNDKYFLCSRTVSGEQMGIFLIDIFGNEIQLHSEAPGCFDPMPLVARFRPGIKTNLRKYTTENPTGKFYIYNVYEGTHMQGVEPGSVKYLRIVESPEKRTRTLTAWSGQGTEWPAMGWHDFNNKRILGTVPVDEDGSAYFEVPADKFVYFQLLDENKQMIQSMRSGTIIQSGEIKGCIGCHENRTDAPSVAVGHDLPSAIQRDPSQLQEWYGPTRMFNFLTEVQPVFTAKCASCHDLDTPGGPKAGLKLAADKSNTFNTAYNELWRKGYTGGIGAGPAAIQQAYAWGSHKSKLIQTLKSESHQNINLTTEQFERIVTWLDINAPYYAEYTSAYPNNLAGRSPLTNSQLDRLAQLTGFNFRGYAGFGSNRGPLISFDRPALSACLANLSGAGYDEALAIIQQGKDNLTAKPRADMDGHTGSADDLDRLSWYQQRLIIEQENRQAIIDGLKKYDE
ncbi:MAG: hypothetical protein JEZ07_05995 [Phycisphaerae bacterium]|nr:hypothetical protein [Phycisphaerae bacterium]